MRRRDLFTLATAMAGCTVTGCTPGDPQAADDPSGEFPIGFAASPAWEGVESWTEFTAVKDRHLVAMTVVPDAERAFAHGWVPVVVDVAGLTTRALLLDDDGTWITKPVTPKKEFGPPTTRLSRTALTAMIQGPAVIDDTHAYIVAGVVPLEAPGQFEGTPSSTPTDLRCPVMLFKIRLDDGAVVASTTVSDDVEARSLKDAALSFTEDGTSLLLAGGAEVSTTSGIGTGWMGLRLSTAELGVEFDARALYIGQEVRSVSSAGQAVLVTSSLNSGKELVRLADGVRVTTSSTKALVIGDWLHHVERKHDQTAGLVAVNMRTGQRVDVTPRAGRVEDLVDVFTSWPGTFTEPRVIIASRYGEGLTVWLPGAPEPSLELAADRAVSTGVAVLGDVLYTWHGDDRATTLTLRRLDSGEVLAEHSVPPRVLGSDIGAVTRWGCISWTRFFRATTWLD
ncbi:hypothetical protein EII34_14325 [Arachnia propionica]|uniref:Uncharacterized protein n=1 Tax=Arachnia propionica TaxID=1750 RepID=A0A3P1T259_9ACTN|nr:hypothetical protein [Arachnia propionica]RRD03365.1 hypothetical protein EII34_14325 [Arachnia propionica]